MTTVTAHTHSGSPAPTTIQLRCPAPTPTSLTCTPSLPVHPCPEQGWREGWCDRLTEQLAHHRRCHGYTSCPTSDL